MQRINVTVSLQEKKGIYQAVLQYKDENGKRKYKWQTTGVKKVKGQVKILIKQAEEIAEKIRSDFEIKLNKKLGNVCIQDRRNMLFSDYMKEWLENIASTKAKTTIGGYQSNINSIISPYFEKKEITLEELKTIDLQDFFDEQYKLGKSARTVVHYYNNIHQALEKARKTGIINTNVSDNCDLERPRQFIPNIYNQNELNDFLGKIKNSDIEVPVLLCAFYGFRREEVIGLKWDKIDWVNDTITISHTVTITTINGKRVINKSDIPKNTSSYRTLPLIPIIKKFLEDIEKNQNENKEIFGNCYKNDENYICVNKEGELINPDSLTKRFSKFLKDNNLKKIRLHDLRHSVGSLLIKKVSTREVQEWLGHSNVSTTQIYTHLDCESKIVSAKAISNMLGYEEKAS